ncbi:hypothetical protein HBI40_235060 [Parastagonospora nodorum]|nr:hypothetical protein HBI95_132930 [Parastagonospora nodorum]KAH4916065.1 hypothetical protein HBI79_230650 [Parastagonospora nodorum]KAH6199720.1 hypothetical protein HBI43_228630 [Parastagonospora nodorum]KAH6242693.1 hypothetical protein HBI42_229560 [Parastagonospora nodorum]KAH6246485.1 hypothetical protein HBI41_235120 [Parastagonospora nodorum]
MTHDRPLFEAFRDHYRQRARWLYRKYSLYTIQKISMVQFALRSRSEVDRLEPGMPPETIGHYTCDPRKPDRVPPLGSDFLMHRFTSPFNCYSDDICLRQFPKRVKERPTPGTEPDNYTGWGIHLEEGLDLERLFLLILIGLLCSLIFGVIWAVCRRSVQDGFTVAGYIVASETLGLTLLQLVLASQVM